MASNPVRKAASSPFSRVDQSDAGWQDVIEVQRLITIGEVHAGPGSEDPMVVVAFRMAGRYLNDEAGKADSSSDAVQFTYLGVTFYASFEASSVNREVEA